MIPPSFGSGGGVLTWKIAMSGREAPLERVVSLSLREIIDPIHDGVSKRLSALDGDLVVVLEVGEDRSLALALRGDVRVVNEARDLLGEQFPIRPVLN
jgi:hypothetical protein